MKLMRRDRFSRPEEQGILLRSELQITKSLQARGFVSSSGQYAAHGISLTRHILQRLLEIQKAAAFSDRRDAPRDSICDAEPH